MTSYPIIYRTIPTQYAFLVSDDGTVKVNVLNSMGEHKFANESEARKWINGLKEII